MIETCVSVGVCVCGGGACMGDRDLCKCGCRCVWGGACMGDRDLCKCVCCGGVGVWGGGMHG